MGKETDPMAVLDSKARVYGVSGLRVVDASSFPILPPGHPMSTVCKSTNTIPTTQRKSLTTYPQMHWPRKSLRISRMATKEHLYAQPLCVKSSIRLACTYDLLFRIHFL
jgi:hypothetical protein